MNNPELPDRLDELMAGYVLGNLSSQEAEELQQFLATQSERAKELDNLQEIWSLMPYALPAIKPPQHLEDRIFQAALSDRQNKPRQKLFFLARGKLAGSIAALLVAALAWNNYNLRQNLMTAQAEIARQKDIVAMLQNPQTHLVSLKGMDMASSASGRIIMTPGESQSVLILQKLPILPKNKYYQLWSVVNGKKVASGQFNASENGTVLVKLPTPSALEVTGLLITLEESSKNQNAPGLMVMTSNL